MPLNLVIIILERGRVVALARHFRAGFLLSRLIRPQFFDGTFGVSLSSRGGGEGAVGVLLSEVHGS